MRNDMMSVMERIAGIVADTGCLPLITLSPARGVLNADGLTYDVDLYIHSSIYYDTTLAKVRTFTLIGYGKNIDAFTFSDLLDHVYPYLACNPHLIHPASDCYERHHVYGKPIGPPDEGAS